MNVLQHCKHECRRFGSSASSVGGGIGWSAAEGGGGGGGGATKSGIVYGAGEACVRVLGTRGMVGAGGAGQTDAKPSVAARV